MMHQLARLIASPQLFLKHQCLGGSQAGNYTLKGESWVYLSVAMPVIGYEEEGWKEMGQWSEGRDGRMRRGLVSERRNEGV